MAFYLDSSAAVKLVVREAESDALRAWLGPDPIVASSSLVRTETLRAVRRAQPQGMAHARAILARFALHDLDDEVLQAAVELDPAILRTLDAIHLATALRLAADLEAIVTYDRRMIDGARALGLPVASPA